MDHEQQRVAIRQVKQSGLEDRSVFQVEPALDRLGPPLHGGERLRLSRQIDDFERHVRVGRRAALQHRVSVTRKSQPQGVVANQQGAEGAAQMLFVERGAWPEEHGLIEVIQVATIVLEEPALNSGQGNVVRPFRVARLFGARRRPPEGTAPIRRSSDAGTDRRRAAASRTVADG